MNTDPGWGIRGEQLVDGELFNIQTERVHLWKHKVEPGVYTGPAFGASQRFDWNYLYFIGSLPILKHEVEQGVFD